MNATPTSNSILNIVFVPSVWGRDVLNAASRYYHQDQEYQFVYCTADPVLDYKIHEQLLHIVKPKRKFRLIALLSDFDSSNRDQARDHTYVSQQLLKLNQYNNRCKVKCFFLSQFKIKNIANSRFTKITDDVTRYDDLCIYFNKNRNDESWHIDYEYLDNATDMSDFMNLDRFWKAFTSNVGKCQNISTIEANFNQESQLLHLVLVDHARAAHFWNKLYREFGSNYQYFFFPGKEYGISSDHNAFYATLCLLAKLNCTTPIKLFGLFDDIPKQQFVGLYGEYYQYFQAQKSKIKYFEIYLYTYISLNLPKSWFMFNKDIRTDSRSYGIMDLYNVAHYEVPADIDGIFHTKCGSLGPTYPNAYDEQKSAAIRKEIWRNFKRIIELDKTKG